MDLLTQAVVGAVAGGATRSVSRGTGSRIDHAGALRAAALTGALAALVADADVLLGNPADPIVAQELHRHFTHALLFVPLGAALVTALLARPLRSRLATAPRFVAAAAGLLTAGLLDACTGFGTHLLWPFSDTRTAWNLISIIDPVFTLLALAPLVLALRSGRHGALQLSLLLMAVYLALAAAQQQRALAAGMMAASARSEVPERMLVRPSFGNILLWRSIYLVDDEWQADAIRLGAPSVCVHPGERAPALQTGDADSRASAQPPTVTTVTTGHGRRRVQPASSSTTRPGWLPVRDMRRLSRLTDDVMVIDAAQRWIGDGRYAMMPDSMKPIWGLRPADEGASAPVEWFTDRTLTPSMRARFLTMLLGTDPDCRER